MYRVLIADPSELFGSSVEQHLQEDCCVCVCTEGNRILDAVRTFEPDVLLLDILFPDVSSLRILQTLQSTGVRVKIIAITRFIDEYTAVRLAQYGVHSLLTRPCKVGLVVNQIRQTLFALEHPDLQDWCLENEIDRILLDLSFRMGPARYQCVFEAIRARYFHIKCSMKELYIDVAKRCGGNFRRVEKAIRDAVADAYEAGDKSVWAMYFPVDNKRDKPYPGNEDFIARIATCLIQRTRLKKPCPYIREKAK